MTRTDKEIEAILDRSREEPYLEFTSDNPESDRQKIYRVRKKLADEAPLLWLNDIAVRVKDQDKIVLEWKHTARPLEVSTDKPKDFEVKIAKQQKKAVKLPKWLESRWADFRAIKETAARLAIDDPKEYLGGWQDLDTLDIACERLAELIENGGADPTLELYIRSADRKYVIPVFLGEEPIERLDPIEILRRQIAEIPTDDPARDNERLKLIERREKLMLERDIRLQSTNPLI